MCDFCVIEAGTDMEPETVCVGSQAGFNDELLTAQCTADIVDVHAGGHALDNLICLGDSRLLHTISRTCSKNVAMFSLRAQASSVSVEV